MDEEEELWRRKTRLMEVSMMGAAAYAKLVTPEIDTISQRKAYIAYGEARVRAWVKAGLLTVSRCGPSSRSKIIYSRAEILAITTAEKLKQLEMR